MALIYNATFDSQTRVLSPLDKAGNVISSCEVPSKGLDDITKPLTFKATQDGSTVKLAKVGSPSGDFQTSRDGGNTWTDYTIDTAITLNTGDEVSFRAKADRTSAQTDKNCFQFMMEGKIEAWHNVMSMYRTNDFSTYNSVVKYAFYQLFDGCTSLTKAPVLPATTLANACYFRMFAGCQSLTKAPALPATTLANACYFQMFSSCQSLTEAPALPATTLASTCYQSMFFSCKSLTQAPALPATTLADGCYDYMFFSCKSLTQAPVLPATTLVDSCYNWMFYGCQSLKEVRVSATKTATDALNSWLSGVSATGDFYCDPSATIFPKDNVSGIPSGWTRRDINTLKALTLTATADNSSVKLTKNGTLDNTFEVDKGNGWEGYVFGTVIHLNAGQSCKWRCSAHPTTQSNKNYVQFVMTGKIEASGNVNSMLSIGFENLTSLSGYDYAYMFKGCTSLTKAPELPATTLVNYCYYYMFAGCTSLVQAPKLPATTLANNCYASMFAGCTSLVQAPELPATTLVNDCYYYMFNYCTSLVQAPELPATTLANNCYVSMFNSCTSLVQAPKLPATTLANNCYAYMFSGCTSLNEVRISATKTATGAFYQWLTSVSATGDFYCDPNATIFPTDSASGIPKNWTRHALADYPVTP